MRVREYRGFWGMVLLCWLVTTAGMSFGLGFPPSEIFFVCGLYVGVPLLVWYLICSDAHRTDRALDQRDRGEIWVQWTTAREGVLRDGHSLAAYLGPGPFEPVRVTLGEYGLLIDDELVELRRWGMRIAELRIDERPTPSLVIQREGTSPRGHRNLSRKSVVVPFPKASLPAIRAALKRLEPQIRWARPREELSAPPAPSRSPPFRRSPAPKRERGSGGSRDRRHRRSSRHNRAAP